MMRKFHLYLGTLFAPLILFFSFSGILQTIGLHEADELDEARPPAWIVAIASVHKDQHLPQLKARKETGALADMRNEHDRHAHSATDPDATAAGAKAAEPKRDLMQVLLKAFVVLMGIGLMVSALLGIVIALNNARTRRTAILLLVAGTILPVVLVIL